LWKSRLPERISLLILEVDPFTKYFIKEGVPSHMPLVSLTEHTLANLLCFSGCLKILLGRGWKHTDMALIKEIT